MNYQDKYSWSIIGVNYCGRALQYNCRYKKIPTIIVQKFTVNIYYKENWQDLMYINLLRLVSIKKILNDKILITWMDGY